MSQTFLSFIHSFFCTRLILTRVEGAQSLSRPKGCQPTTGRTYTHPFNTCAHTYGPLESPIHLTGMPLDWNIHSSQFMFIYTAFTKQLYRIQVQRSEQAKGDRGTKTQKRKPSSLERKKESFYGDKQQKKALVCKRYPCCRSMDNRAGTIRVNKSWILLEEYLRMSSPHQQEQQPPPGVLNSSTVLLHDLPLTQFSSARACSEAEKLYILLM